MGKTEDDYHLSNMADYYSFQSINISNKSPRGHEEDRLRLPSNDLRVSEPVQFNMPRNTFQNFKMQYQNNEIVVSSNQKEDSRLSPLTKELGKDQSKEGLEGLPEFIENYSSREVTF